jgi:predicted RNA binding protein YcfA (HicA-like mRNA interferase family)
MKQASGKRFCRILEAHGWVLQRIKGSHHVYGKIGEENKISVPVHGNKPIRMGLLKYLMTIAGLKEKDL